MTVQINFSNGNKLKNTSTFVTFCSEKYSIQDLNTSIIKNYQKSIKDYLLALKPKAEKFVLYNLDSNKRVILIKIKNFKERLVNEKLGADLFDFVKKNSITELFFLDNMKEGLNENKNFLSEFIHGFNLKS